MSEPIQSIAQNNYILHNIDAKKLYVQEPLFTANSGDAVYVGWRPDETVLWSGDSQTGTFSENISAFEMVRFHMRDDTHIIGVGTLYTDDILSDGNYIIGCGTSVWQPGSSPVRVLSVSGNLTGFNSNSANYQWWSKNDGGFANFKVQKVVGINRKENA